MVEIPEMDVRYWLKSEPVTNWWKAKFEKDFADRLIEDFTVNSHDWNWKDPALILDKISFKLAGLNGMMQLLEAWKSVS